MNTSVTSIPAANALETRPLVNFTDLAGRVLLAQLFLLSGLNKLGAYSATAGYMQSMGVPGALLPLVIATEIGGALALILGWRMRIGALLLAGFTFLAACIFHRNFADQNQMIHFMKNITIVGGLLVLVARGAGPLSLDAWRARRSPRFARGNDGC